MRPLLPTGMLPSQTSPPLPPGRRGRLGLAVAAVVCAVVVAGCGKKGPPLAPIVRIPAPVTAVAAARAGSDVFLTFTVPEANIDGTTPADVARVDLFAYTGIAAPPRNRFADLASLVASVPVSPPPLPAGDAPIEPLSGPSDPIPGGAVQGESVTVRERLEADDLVQGPVDVEPRRAAVPPALVPVAAPAGPPVLRRFYMAIPFSPGGVPGPPGTPVELVLSDLPEPPAAVRATYGESAVTIRWEPSAGLLGFLIDRALPAEPVPYFLIGAAPPAPVTSALPPGPTTYNVYRVSAPDPLAPPGAERAEWRASAPAPLNAAPLAALSFTDPEIAFGRERCYTVRAVRGPVVSEPSPPVCGTPVDLFPPAAPAGLTAIASEDGISLLWEPNGEVDLGGYLVLRREVGDATLRLLTDTPIPDARFVDRTVAPGTRYAYTVVAVDTRMPLPNLSAESVPVEETAR